MTKWTLRFIAFSLVIGLAGLALTSQTSFAQDADEEAAQTEKMKSKHEMMKKKHGKHMEGMSEEDRAAMKKRMESMSEEDRAAMKKKMAGMSAEERKAKHNEMMAKRKKMKKKMKEKGDDDDL